MRLTMTGNRVWPVLLAGLLAVTSYAPDVSGQWRRRRDNSGIWFDEDTGRDLAHWPPARPFDHLHMRLELDIPSMDEPFLSAVEALTVRAIGQRREEIVLDAGPMEIESVRVAGEEATFDHDDGKLTVEFPRPLERNEQAVMEMRYTLDFGEPGGRGLIGGGLSWSPGDPNGERDTDRAPQVHSQGQAEANSLWFICHDFPNEQLTTELIVTVDSAFLVSSNGRLAERSRAGPGRTRWHWVQDKPHVNYLVTLVIGVFDVVNVGGAHTARPGLPMPVYVPTGTATNAAKVFAGTPAMIAFFEKTFDEPYPWDRYAQLAVRHFGGGMENTSATTLYEQTAMSPPGGEDSLIAHELAHQWFGDLVTCRSWEHIWLNEGWATYAEILWSEHVNGWDTYIARIRGNLGGSGNGTAAPDDPGMVSNYYRSADSTFGRRNNPYSKGALLLHMLRMRLGDETFWTGTRLYLDRYKYGVAETDDFRRVLEEVSGVDLERFFDQWARRPGIPALNVRTEWIAEPGELAVDAEQTQRIDEHNPPFVFDLPIRLTLPDTTQIVVTLSVDGAHASARFALPGEPSNIEVNPEVSVAAMARLNPEPSEESRGAEAEGE